MKCWPEPVGCARWILQEEFIKWDQESKAEIAISHFCIDCQNKIFEKQGTINGLSPNEYREMVRAIEEDDPSRHNIEEEIVGQYGEDDIPGTEIPPPPAGDTELKSKQD